MYRAPGRHPQDPLDVARRPARRNDQSTASLWTRELALQLTAQVVAVRAAPNCVELVLQLAAEVDPVRQRDGVVCR